MSDKFGDRYCRLRNFSIFIFQKIPFMSRKTKIIIQILAVLLICVYLIPRKPLSSYFRTDDKDSNIQAARSIHAKEYDINTDSLEFIQTWDTLCTLLQKCDTESAKQFIASSLHQYGSRQSDVILEPQQRIHALNSALYLQMQCELCNSCFGDSLKKFRLKHKPEYNFTDGFLPGLSFRRIDGKWRLAAVTIL